MTLESRDVDENSFSATVHQEYKILAEYKMIQRENIGGVYVIPSNSSSLLWFGVIFIREGIYMNAIFRFTISLPKKFPNCLEVPTVTFQSKLIHPLVNPETGTLDISDVFFEWKSHECHIWHILKFIQFIFLHTIAYGNGKVSDQSAADLLQTDRSAFLAKVKEYVELSEKQLYDATPTNDSHYITFEPFQQDVHGSVLDDMKKKGDLSISPLASGLSWVNDTNYQKSTK